MNDVLHVAIVDDEPLARDRLHRMLSDIDGIAVDCICTGDDTTLQTLMQHNLDVVFLDIELGGQTGFDVLHATSWTSSPAIIFVTAYSQHAVQAFETEALDYILKPFNAERLTQAIEKVRKRKALEANQQIKHTLDAALDSHLKAPKYLKRFIVKSGNRHFFFPVTEVDWIESDGNYALLHVGEAEHVIRTTMNDLEKRLDPETFVRIHRSTMVRLDAIQEVQKSKDGSVTAVLHSGTALQISRSHWANFMDKAG